jgi:hypothetical protein
MATIYEKTPGALIATPGRSVATFPSGLVRVDQKFVCRDDQKETARFDLSPGNSFPAQDLPCQDGCNIFPTPQETQRGDGFYEFSVSGYGRENSVGTSSVSVPYTFRLQVVGFIAGDFEADPPTQSEYFFADRLYTSTALVVTKVILSSEAVSVGSLIGQIPTPTMIEGPAPGGDQNWPGHNYTPRIESVVSTNFGTFTEVQITAKYL